MPRKNFSNFRFEEKEQEQIQPIFSLPLQSLSTFWYILHVCMHACESLQLCPPLCTLMDYSPPDSSVHGILQEKLLEQVAPPPGDLPKPGIKLESLTSHALAGRFLPLAPPGKPIFYIQSIVVQSLSQVRLFRDPMDCIARQVPLSMGFPRQEYPSGLPFPTWKGSSQPREL